ncbi:integrase, catalytic region, zinc finger, CCHC-type containing protein [Tanacetum coccineum]|uniref:Integrase, catalytic region, zinc finger, CCHC-type containing protein n=1 Tax=Tanacetum coccineum TaxID=301880 RepID=A0ABQ5C8C5_9ASTR
MVEEVTSLKKDFKQKENKYHEEFLDMKALKEKVKDRLYKQDQSLQAVHMLCKPKPYYNELNKVAIGYKKPLCLTRAKQVQSALYNGYEIVKNNHVPAIVHNTKDTLEIAEIIRRKMHDKMKDPECVTHKMKAKALKEQTTSSRPIKALTVYPPNTPATLVPKVLPTKSQVKINIFALIQLFSDFEKTYNKRITPTGLTEGERGFKQTKACYLTEVIPFFKTLKEHLKGIQKALTKEVKEMKEIFEELEAEVDQHVIDMKHDEIERKNLLIANDNLIVDCLFKDVFHVATNSKHNVSSFTEMHDAHISLKARCLELEVELSNLHDKIQKDNHDELIKWFSNLEVQIQNKLSCVNKDQVKPKVLAPGKYAIDVEPIPPRNRNNRSLASACCYTKHSQELLEDVIGTCPKAPNTRDNKHAFTSLPKEKQVTFEEQCAMSKRVNSCTDASGSQPRSNTKKNRILPAKSINMKKVEEHPKTIKSSLKTTNRVDSSISSKRTVINSNSHSVFQTCNKCLIFANHDMCVVTYLHSVNASPSVKNVVRKVKQVWKPKQVKQVWKPTGNILTTVGDRSRLRNFVKKFIGTVRFGNDHFGAIMGYGDYVIGESVISRVYYVEGLGHNLFFVGQFYDSDLEVAFRKHSCYVQDTDSVELIKGSCGFNLYIILIEDMLKSSPICLLSKASKNKSWLWHRRLNHLNFGTINDLARKDLVRGLPRLKFEKDHLCSACQLGKSKKHTHKPNTENTNLEVLNTLHMDLCRLMRVQTINGKKYILVINGVVERRNRTLVEAARTMLIFSKAPMFLWAEAVATACYTQNRSLIHTRHCKTPYDLVHDKKPDLTFFRVFGASVQVPVNSTDTPSSTTIDQDAPSPSHSSSSLALQYPSVHQGIAADSPLMDDNPFAPIDNDNFINVFATGNLV